MAVRSFTVGQINGYIKNLISSDMFLGNIYVKGEISNCKYHSSGHIYFSLKDSTGSIAAVMFRSSVASGLGFHLENGQLVIAHGNVDVYDRDGKYQLYVKDISLDGRGNLYEQYEQLKQKLYEQGLFDFEIKKEIPKFPRKVGIVTAPTGAAIQDIRNIAKRRNPFVQLVLYPARVQGEGAACEIAKGIEVLDKLQLDTIIIGRGGGSIEDLWAFNEEVVAWAIYHAVTPIISGTGHEIDNTIADYAADMRAPTPSAACELAIPDVMTVLNEINQLNSRLAQLIQYKINGYAAQIEAISKKIDLLSPKGRVSNHQLCLDALDDRIAHGMKAKYDNRYHRLMILCERINGLSPTAKLVNGFGYLSKDNEPIKSASQVKKSDAIEIVVHDGRIRAMVSDVDYVKQDFFL